MGGFTLGRIQLTWRPLEIPGTPASLVTNTSRHSIATHSSTPNPRVVNSFFGRGKRSIQAKDVFARARTLLGLDDLFSSVERGRLGFD